MENGRFTVFLATNLWDWLKMLDFKRLLSNILYTSNLDTQSPSGLCAQLIMQIGTIIKFFVLLLMKKLQVDLNVIIPFSINPRTKTYRGCEYDYESKRYKI